MIFKIMTNYNINIYLTSSEHKKKPYYKDYYQKHRRKCDVCKGIYLVGKEEEHTYKQKHLKAVDKMLNKYFL